MFPRQNYFFHLKLHKLGCLKGCHVRLSRLNLHRSIIISFLIHSFIFIQIDSVLSHHQITLINPTPSFKIHRFASLLILSYQDGTCAIEVIRIDSWISLKKRQTLVQDRNFKSHQHLIS